MLLMLAELIVLMLSAVALLVFHSAAIGPYCVAVAAPIVSAIAAVSLLLVRAPYTGLALALGSQRTEKGPGILGVVLSNDGRVLMNKQSEDPWENLWVAIGGYHSNKNEGFGDVAVRRVRELTQCDALALKYRDRIAKASKEDVAYTGDSIDAGHAPIDVVAFWITDSNNECIDPAAIPEKADVQWWTLEMLESAAGNVPFHHRDLLHGLLSKETGAGAYEYWDVEEAVLEQMFP